ncbi:adaptin family protein [Hibiscus syriacus]|uniref:Adaptin family protein n=1 Tax=Hibiscus syriacus TaxID=106335 RepID=A0A6A2YMK5_HIBSY|nr:DDT domain-containing protein PTM-like [Hibiscus syriacus]XP_039026360.1 DDT domain-containing protein PTM-like [Hibiscus syriacus]KAE8680535.1 adaptin family protein [Hibiscus syriacus]
MEATLKRPRGRPRKRPRPEEENGSAVGDAKFNNSKTKKRMLETRSIAFVGRYVLKEFGGSGFLGKIVSYDTGLYRVDYEDGDFEDLESGELRELILEESYFDDDLSRKKVRLDELVLRRIVKKRELEEEMKKLEVLKNEADVLETSAGSKLSDAMMDENEGEQDKDDADSSSDSCEHAHDRELSLESEIPLIPPPILPPSSGTIGVPEECVSHLFSVYGFLRSFSIILFLNPFGLDDFVGSLNCSEPNPLLDAVHVALMRALCCHLETISSEGSELASKCLRCLDWSLLDTLTWPAYVVQYFVIMGYAGGPEWKGFYEYVAEREYYSLPVSRKLMILQILCDDVLDYAELRAEIDMREATEVGVDPDAVVIDPLEKGPTRIHPIYYKTSACKGRELMGITSEGYEVKSSSRTSSLGLRNTGGTVGVDTDVDGNSDECRLCGMDGTLLCCDGCPSAYHSRCIGVMKIHIPDGPWYCPECVIDKMGPEITVNTSLRGAELFGVDSYGQVFLGTCNHLLVLKASLDTESYVRYYNLNDIPKVLQVLSSSIEHKTLYLDICKAITHYWNVPENIVSPLEIGGSVAKTKEDAKFFAGLPLSVVKDSHKFSGSVDVENASSFCGRNVGVLSPDTSMFAMNQTDLPGSLSNGRTMGGKDHPPMNKKLSEQIYIESAVSAASVSQQTASDVTHQSLVDRSNVIDHTSCASGSSSNNYGGAANGIYMFCQSQSKVGKQIGFGRDARNSAVDYLYMGISFKPQPYVNHYNYGHFAATAAAKLAVLSSEESQVSEVNKSGSARKVASDSSMLLQVKAFSLAASRFFWPSAEKKLLDIPRERCGWCYSCKVPASSRRGCMLNSAVSTATKSTNKVLSGLPSLKNGRGSLPSIATYILYMEETLCGLVAGSFLNQDYRKQWRRKLEEASTCRAIKILLLDLEENISVTALSADWVKLMDDCLVDPCVIQSTTSSVGLSQKQGPGGRRRRKQSIASEVTADDSDDKSFDWWRGGRLSTYVFQKAILPASMVRKAAQQGGGRKISGINYVDDFEIPKRSRQLIWRAAVERSMNTAQLALQVRYLDLHVRWNDLVRPDHNISDGKGSETEASVFRNAFICDKKTVGSKIQYGVAFGNQKHLPSRVMKNIIDIEQTENKKEKYWFHLTHIPLYLIKEYEERMSVSVLPSVKKPFTELSELQRRQLKASRRNMFAYLISKRDKLEKCSCASCQMDVFLRDAVKCGTCLGYCHQDCTLSSMHMNGKVECLTICKGCYHAKVLARNEINSKSPTALLPFQGRDCCSAPAATKGMQVKSSTQPMKPLASNRSKENQVRIQEKRYDTKKSALNNGSGAKRGKLCNWGVIWRKKNSESETGIKFRQAHILTKDVSDNHSLYPTCELCQQPYNSDLMYIHCETCRKWYHAEAVELDESKVSDVVGFKCCKCRRIKGPECPFMDAELREQKRKKQFGKLQKQGQGSLALDSDLGTISDIKEFSPVTPMISTEDELGYAHDPQVFSLSKVEQITEYISEVGVELDNASATGPQKLRVRRQIKREGEAHGLSGDGLEHVELSAYPEPNDFARPKGDSSIPFAQWDVSSNGGFEGVLLLDYENLNYEDMEFEPQTYFSFTELLASDDGTGDGLKDSDNQVDPMNPDVTALHCHVCLQNEPAPELYCDICGFLTHTQCSLWDESSSSESSWRCGRCREWR